MYTLNRLCIGALGPKFFLKLCALIFTLNIYLNSFVLLFSLLSFVAFIRVFSSMLFVDFDSIHLLTHDFRSR